MKEYLLKINWQYHYDKEGTWEDHDAGEDRYALTVGAVYGLPHMMRKTMVITSIADEGESLVVEMRVDGYPVTVRSGEEPVSKHISYDYMACGDSVHTTLYLAISLVPNE